MADACCQTCCCALGVSMKLVMSDIVSTVTRCLYRILGDGNKNLNKIVEVFVKVLAHGTELAESETADQMVSLLTQMQGSLPPQVGSHGHDVLPGNWPYVILVSICFTEIFEAGCSSMTVMACPALCCLLFLSPWVAARACCTCVMCNQPSSPLQVFQSFFNSLSAKERKELQSRVTRNGT